MVLGQGLQTGRWDHAVSLLPVRENAVNLPRKTREYLQPHYTSSRGKEFNRIGMN